MSQALYRKYRSKSLDEVVGQDHVTSVLKNSLKSGKTAHAYLLTGPRGVGKTSIARILAHEINQLPYTDESDHLDIIEIDAASNNGVDDVRDLRDKALVAPTSAAKKIYIIDEVHMLSKAAFNALLKILEEPPAHVTFILATTDFDKLPPTIISRTQRFHFHLVGEENVAGHLRFIADQEKISIEDSALQLIARRGGGSFRDSISLLDQMQSIEPDGVISLELVESTLGLATQSQLTEIIEAELAGATDKIIQVLHELERLGVSAPTIASQLIDEIRSKLTTYPTLVHLLEGLNDTLRSSRPEVKLLITLLEPVVAKTKPAAQPIPSTPTAKKPVESSKPKKQAGSAKKTVAAKAAEEPPIKLPKEGVPSADLSDFDWQKVLEYTKEHDHQFTAGVHTLLKKCVGHAENGKITLYTGNQFTKKQLDSPKKRPILIKILQECGYADVDIDTIASPPPPKDEQAARIAAMMGGGEEVDVS